MQEMVLAGNVFGGHSKSHGTLSILSEEVQKQEIEACYDLLDSLYCTSRGFLPFSYPYGAFNETTSRLVEAAGFACAFTATPGINQSLQAPFEINRLDTIDLPFFSNAPVSEWTLKAAVAQTRGESL